MLHLLLLVVKLMSEEQIMLENRELLPLKARIQLMEPDLLQEQIPKMN